MGWLDRFRRTATTDADDETAVHAPEPERARTALPVGWDGEARWYVPVDDDRNRFAGTDGALPALHLIDYRDSNGERVLRLCEDSTGLLVGPTDRRLAPVGIYVSQLRGESHYRTACRRGDFAPGTPVRLKREPDNPYDPNAVAITADADGAPVAAYVNKQKARSLAKLLDAGMPLRAISLRGTPAGQACEQIAVLVGAPEVVEHLLSPRPRDLPRPAHRR